MKKIICLVFLLGIAVNCFAVKYTIELTTEQDDAIKELWSVYYSSNSANVQLIIQTYFKNMADVYTNDKLNLEFNTKTIEQKKNLLEE